MELKNKVINFLGDSITEGCGTSGVNARFSHLIAERCGLKRENNYGICGTRIARQHKPYAEPSFDLDFCMRCREMDPDADIILVFGGTNDYGHGDAPLGTPEDRTPDTYRGACHYMMRTLRELYPEAVVVIMTPLHRLNEDNPRGDNKTEDVAPLSVYVQILRETAEYYSLPILDLWSMSGFQPAVDAVRERLMPDGLHPNDAGHVILADRIIGFLSAL